MNVQRGDLARVVSNGMPDMSPGIVDRIVEVVRLAYPGEKFRATTGEITTFYPGHGVCWVIRSKTPLPGTVWHRGQPERLFFDERAIGDEYLRRLGGVPVEDDVRDEEPISCD